MTSQVLFTAMQASFNVTLSALKRKDHYMQKKQLGQEIGLFAQVSVLQRTE